MSSDNNEKFLLDAAKAGDHPRVARFLEAGADPNLADKDGQTPLYGASQYGHAEVVKLLLDAGSDPNLANKDGQTPLSIAVARNEQNTAYLLEHWPRVVPLQTLCLRVIRTKPNGVSVPKWVPRVLLEYPSFEEMVSVATSSKAAFKPSTPLS